jgi:hypothetical protein
VTTPLFGIAPSTVTQPWRRPGPLVPWCTTPASGRAIEAARHEVGDRAAWCLAVAPFEGWHGPGRSTLP